MFYSVQSLPILQLTLSFSPFHNIPGLKIASDWSPWATKNRPGRLETMIQEPIGELHIGLSATAVALIPFFLFQCRAKINHPRHHVTTKYEMSRV